MTDTPEAAAISDLLGQAIEKHRGFAFEEAEKLYREVLERDPAHADALHNLGVLYAIGLGRPLEALPHFEAALNFGAGRPQFWFSYVDALLRAGEREMARQSMLLAQAQGLPRIQLQALAERLARIPVAPSPAETVPAAGAGGAVSLDTQRALVALFQQRDYAHGEARARALLEHHPDDAFLWKSLGAMLQVQGRKHEALQAKQRAVALDPGDAEALCNLGRAHFELEQRGPAITALRAALALRPDHAETLNNLGLVVNAEGQVADAAAHFERAVALQPGFAEAWNNLSGIYTAQGLVAQAVDALSRAVQANPDYRAAFDNLLFVMNYHPDATDAQVQAAYAAYEERFGVPARAFWKDHANRPAEGRRLRVGYVSPDFRHHACTFFMEPLLSGHDRGSFEVFAYAEMRRPGDALTARYQGLVAHWVPTEDMDAQALAERIRADRIDILVDLAGHTKGNRLDAFARKPAPVSLSWLGCASTTGLRAIDYHLTDEASAPPGSEAMFSEAPWRLPGLPFAVYRPADGMGEPGPLPALRAGHITFGTLTRGVRINHHTVRAWARLLQRVPRAHLVIDSRSFADPALADAMAARFAAHGIARERLAIGCHSPPWDLLRSIDIGLDCFPHNSGTTLFESLYMGVPFVTLAGRPSVGRVGSAVLHGLGRPQWIAHSEDEYVDKLVALAQDLPALAQLRAGLRAQMQASALMDEAGFVRAVEDGYREMFARWQARQQPCSPAPTAASADAEIAALRAELLFNEGNAQHGRGEHAAAESSWRQALALCPQHAQAWNNLGLLQQDQGRLAEAERAYRAALQAQPDYALAHHNLGNLLQHLGDIGAAVEGYRRAHALGLRSQHLYDNLLFLLNYHPDLGAEQIYADYRAFDRDFGAPWRGQWRAHANARDAQRRLKVGYVSPDFRQHACMRFLEPLLQAHDKSAVEVFAYAELAREDAVTARYRQCVDHWVPTQGLDDAALAERIRADGIDVLVDLAGHTRGNRLGVFARKPAPVSVSWLGYAYSTGLSAIDYYLTDAATVPEGAQAVFSETPWRLPVGLVFRPDPAMGEPGPLPALAAGCVTFGTLTRAIRINHHSVRVWAQILHRVPGARLVVDSRNFSDAEACRRLRAQFAAHGIGAERLALGCHSPPWDLLRTVDIGLDCFPHNSGTTLFEMVHMGIPIVTLAGRPSVGRIGSALLQGLGRTEWIAHSEAEYVDKAVALAVDLPALAAARGRLRAELAASPLRDEAGFARAVEAAYRQMYQRYLDGPSATHAPREPSRQQVQELVELFGARRFAEGERLARALIQDFPAHGFAWKALGVLLQAQGRAEAALEAKRRAVELLPQDAEAFCNLGHALQSGGYYAQAEQALAQALALRPAYLEASNNLALALQKQGRHDEALAHFEQALALQPRHEDIYSNMLFTLNYHPDRSAQQIFAAYREYDRRFGQPLRGRWAPHANPRVPGRRLKVGYVSPDFRAHACARFLEPLLAAHDRQAVEVWAYAELDREDAVTARYRQLVDHWVPTRGMADAALAERIRADGIDILVDLAGHTVGNRLGAFAHKPAPVSLSWLGFAYTTGLSAIDHYLTDAASVPPGAEALFAESPWRLPVGLVYRPAEGMGEVGPLPALRHGHVTLGTLTRAVRINAHTLAVWASILRRLPQARLVVDSSSYERPEARQALVERFAALGVAAERLSIGYHSPPWDLLRSIDIGLDCFPHNSGTTLFESLHMGVPFVTLAGRPSVGRVGSAVLHGLGRTEWIAHSAAEYEDKVVALAQDLTALAQLRAGLRAQMQASALADEAGFARTVEQAYRQMFAQWCEGSADPLVRLVQRAQDLCAQADVAQAQGRLEQAESCLQRAVALVPEFAEAHDNLGQVLQAMGRLTEAQDSHRAALALQPQSAIAHHNLGVCLQAQGQAAAAEASLRAALVLDPALQPARRALDLVLREQGRWVESEVHWREALRQRPDDADAYVQLSQVLARQHRHAEALDCLQRALQARPDAVPVLRHLGVLYKELRRFAEAEDCLRRALDIEPSSAVTWNNLAEIWNATQRLEEAEQGYRRALALDPELAHAHGNLGVVLQNQGRQQEAEDSMRRGLALRPDDVVAHGNLLFVLNYHPRKTAAEVFEEYRRHDAMFYVRHRADWQPHANPPPAGRRLKIGYVSPDFRNHSCMYFMEPLLSQHDRSAVTLYAYAELQRPDTATARYQQMVDYWVPTLGVSDAALAERIRADGIDILVDLAGHTAGNRLGVFARKPAPVSLSWLGYVYTTGLSAIDHYLTDAWHAPPGSEAFFSEAPWRLPHCWVYRPPAPAQTGAPGPSPAEASGHVTFGTLTRAVRINDDTVRVWSQLLRRVPTARLVVDSPSYRDPQNCRLLAARFVAQGVAAERLSIGCSASGWDALRRIDISLDCFPHNSGTTLFESLYMGVPFVTLAGRPGVGCMGSSILQALGRPQWVAHSEATYLDAAAALAADLPALAALRAVLRAELQRSPLMDEAGFARQVEAAYQAMFARWHSARHEETSA